MERSPVISWLFHMRALCKYMFVNSIFRLITRYKIYCNGFIENNIMHRCFKGRFVPKPSATIQLVLFYECSEHCFMSTVVAVNK